MKSMRSATDSSTLFQNLLQLRHRSNTMVDQELRVHKRLSTDLSVNGNHKRRYRGLFSAAENAHLKAMCAQFSCLFHDVIPIINAQGSRNVKGGMCRDFSCPHGIALSALLRTECSIIATAHKKDRRSSERGKLQEKHSRAMKEIEEYYDNRHLINPFVAYWLANFGALPAPPGNSARVEFDKVPCSMWTPPF